MSSTEINDEMYKGLFSSVHVNMTGMHELDLLFGSPYPS